MYAVIGTELFAGVQSIMTLSGLQIVTGANGVAGRLPIVTNTTLESILYPKVLTALTLKLYFVSTVKF